MIHTSLMHDRIVCCGYLNAAELARFGIYCEKGKV